MKKRKYKLHIYVNFAVTFTTHNKLDTPRERRISLLKYAVGGPVLDFPIRCFTISQKE